jgi:3-phosphoshikimate 1-carboxyvinyltransferase
MMPSGLTVHLVGDQVSYPYVDMTIRIMEEFGIVVGRVGASLVVHPGQYLPAKLKTNSYTVEADWSSAAFWYEAAALANCAELTLPGLHEESLQGDAILPELFKPIGVETIFGQEGAVLVKTQGTGHGAHMAAGSLQKNDRKSTAGDRLGQAEPIELVENHIDLGAYPDLAPSLIVTYAALGIAARFTGLHHLKIKESDRLQSLITELRRLNVFIRHPASGIIETDASQSIELTPGNCPPVTIETYSDHRIAMAFALLSTRTGSIRISDPAVVAKSYPGFWKELERLGFEICET